MGPQEYAVTVFDWFGVLDTLGPPVELWDTLKRETLEVAKVCVGGHPRSRSGFSSVETLDSIQDNRTARLAGNRD